MRFLTAVLQILTMTHLDQRPIVGRRTRAVLVLSAVVTGAALAIFVGPGRTEVAVAHPGGLDANGCHNDRKNGGYHCHRSPVTPSLPAAERVPDRAPTTAIPSPALAAPATVAPSSNAEISGTFVRFDRATRVLVIQDAIAMRFEIAMRDDTLIFGGQRMDDYLESTPGGSMPWVTGEAIAVRWRPSADRTKRVAVSVR